MKSIIPLDYEIKVLKINVLDSTLENYKKISFMKESISNLLFYFDNLKNSKFKPLQIQQRKIGLYQEIDIEDKNLIFINFKYGDSVVKSNNSIIIENDEITQTINKTGDFLNDFPCGMSFNVTEDTKYLFISGKMCLLSNGNEQMKGKLIDMFEKIYKHNDQGENTIKPVISINFHFTKDEVQLIDQKVRGIKLSFDVPKMNLFNQGEVGSSKNNARLEIKFSGWKNIGADNEKEFEAFLGNLEDKLGTFGKLKSKTAIVRDNKKTYQTDISNINDELVVNLKEAVIISAKEISYQDFKKHSKTYLK